ncbi:troponin i [Anaeramoeba flamelloides]|uniref:Troponin i n=1 Tax=Anaeramoeba flamelloides TaxID=1746091 RepID=A0ABQ8XN57_9EUKA|nr:troponin i [Anaeramoeba flamelloides]
MQIIDHQLNEQTKEKNEKSNENSKEKENEKKKKRKRKECKKEKEEIDKKNLQNYNITRAITQYRKLNLEKANELLNIEINSNSNNYLIWAWKSIFTVAANGKRGVEESLGYWEKAIKIIGDEEKIPNEIVLALSESLMDTLQLERAKVLLLKRVPADLTQNKKRKQTIKNTKTETTKPLPLLIISRLALIHILQGENSKASELIIHSMSISDFTFHENRSNYFLLSSILSLSKEWYNRALWETINFLNENIASQSQQANELALFISAISRNKLDLFELAKKDWETIIKLKGETPFLLDWFKNNFEN